MTNITIVVEGGVVQDVLGLPEGWTYEIDDRDDDREAIEEVWCSCPEGSVEREKCMLDASYMTDGACAYTKCGVRKHHYHGGVCKKIVQIG